MKVLIRQTAREGAEAYQFMKVPIRQTAREGVGAYRFMKVTGT